MDRNNANSTPGNTNVLGNVIISAYYYVQVAQVQSNIMTFNLKLFAMYLNYLVPFINIFEQNCKRTK